jgi:hypothetical protein
MNRPPARLALRRIGPRIEDDELRLERAPEVADDACSASDGSEAGPERGILLEPEGARVLEETEGAAREACDVLVAVPVEVPHRRRRETRHGLGGDPAPGSFGGALDEPVAPRAVVREHRGLAIRSGKDHDVEVDVPVGVGREELRGREVGRGHPRLGRDLAVAAIGCCSDHRDRTFPPSARSCRG